MEIPFAATRRRFFLRALAGGLLAGIAARISPLRSATLASPLLEIERVAAQATGSPTFHSRMYRVRAIVTLVSVPIVSKDNVGGAAVSIEHSAGGPSRTTAIQFCGGSWPDRLKGFNRFGITQEVVRREASEIAESAFYGFMTSSPEKGLDQARSAFSFKASSTPIAVGHGATSRAGWLSALDRLNAPPGYNWLNGSQLLEKIRERLSPALETPAAPGGAGPLSTFLYAVHTAMQAGKPLQRHFFHNARLHRLETRIAADNGWTLLTGRIFEGHSEGKSGYQSEFRVWFDPQDPSGLPVRFEFHAKSYLHLVFEHDPSIAGPAMAHLISAPV